MKSRLFTARQRLRELLDQAMQETGIQAGQTKQAETAETKIGRAGAQTRLEIPDAYRIEPTQKGRINPIVQALTAGDQKTQEVEGGLS